MKKTIKKAATSSATNYLKISNTKLKLESYSKGKKLETGRYIPVFYAKGRVKLLNTSQLLPKRIGTAARFAGIGKQLIEVFTPDYGYGYNGPQGGGVALLFPGRFVLRKSTAYETSGSAGWHLQTTVTNRDEELDFNIYMGDWNGPQPSPVQHRMTIEAHFNLIAQGEAILSITVNGAEVKYQFEQGESKVLIYLIKPADSNFSHFNMKLKRADNPSQNSPFYITRIERYSELYLQQDLGIFENQVNNPI